MKSDKDEVNCEEIELNDGDGTIKVIVTQPNHGVGGFVNPSFDKSDLVDGESKFPSNNHHGANQDGVGQSGAVDGGQDEALHLITTSKTPTKDFTLEVRASLDIKHYLNEMTILMDLQQIDGDFYTLTNHLLKQMNRQSKYKSKLDLDEVMGSIFSDKEYKLIANRIQGVTANNSGSNVFDSSWVCLLGSGVSVKNHMIGLGRTTGPINLGDSMENIRFILIILTPAIEKQTKNSYEIGRTFATLLMDSSLRFDLLESPNEESARHSIKQKAEELAIRESSTSKSTHNAGLDTSLWENISRRVRWYHTDFIDGFVGQKTFHKTLATSLFLYFACLLPSIAFGVLNSKNTNGLIGPERALIGQALGGIFFALVGGQPLVIIATTALVSLYIKVVYEIAAQLEVDFFVMYASVGFWNTLFVISYAIFGWSKLIRFATRSVEEIFAQFITICFFWDALNGCIESFKNYYYTDACQNITTIDANLNGTITNELAVCQREGALLHLLLTLGTVWLSLQVYKFNQSPFLGRGMREFVSDYALPIGVLGFAAISKLIFYDVKVDSFDFSASITISRSYVDFSSFKIIGSCIVLGFALSLLFFMDQNITGQIVNAPTNHLKKGSAPHLDLLVIGVINCILSFYGLPWMHGILPHSPLHVRSLADTEERNNQGLIETQIIRVRETRVTALFCNILIRLSLFMIPYPLNLLPVPVLDGLFLYCAFASLRGSSMFERMCLLFQEQSSYPPNHYVRRVRQRIIHTFTLCEITQLVILVFIGFAPWAYLRMAFPVFIALLMPVRHYILPVFLDKKTLKLLDSYG